MSFSLLQWNVWYKESPENIAKFLSEVDADVICMQELTQGMEIHQFRDVFAWLQSELHYFGYFHEGHRWPRAEQRIETIGNGILSRFPIQNSYHEFVQFPFEEKKTPYAEEGRVYVEVEVEIAGESVTVGTVHLSYTDRFQDMTHQQQETDRLLEIVKKKQGKYILTGDLNAVPSSTVVHRLQKHLQHCGPDFSTKTWTTKHHKHANYEANSLDWRLDYVFATRDIQVLESKTLLTPISDHLPMWFRLTV